MTYLPLARKYRPQTFEDLIGQPHVTRTLTQALKAKRIAQAYLFTGQRGVGKTSAARILAKCLNCAEGITAKPCNACSCCAQITQGSSLDVIEIDGASNRGIDEIRSLRQTVPFAPTTGPFRVYIIDEVHMLTTEAFNALLKTLEEPPAHVKFVFATTAVNKLPATILSRCQRFDLRRVEAATIVEVLTRIADAEQIKITEPALFAIARASDGSLRDAEVVLEQAASFVQGAIEERDVTELLGAVESETLFAWAKAILERNPPKSLEILMAQLEQGRDAPQLLTSLMRHLRNLLVIRSIREAPSRDALLARLVDEPSDRLTRLEEQAGGSSAQELLLLLQVLAGAYELVRRSPLAQTILELVVIKLATREQWQSLEAISRRLEQLSAGPPPVSEAHTVRTETPRARPDSPSAQRPAPVATPAEPSAPPTPPDLHPPATPITEPGTASVSLSAPEQLQAKWAAFLERLGAQKMSLAAYLAHATPLSLDGAALTVGLPGYALHQEVLSVAEHQRLIERLLSEICQAPMTIRYTRLAEPAEPQQPEKPAQVAGPSTPPIVQEIVNLFNATLIDRPGTT